MNAISDLYPSRRQARPGLIERRDPVLWGDGTGGPLSAEDLAAFDRDGYLWLPGFLDTAEVAALSAELEAVRAAAAAGGPSDEVIGEPDSDIVRSVFRVHETSPTLRRLCADARFAGRARQILGSSVYVHQSRINFKPAFRGKEFYWHSDFETWHVEDGVPRMRMVSCAVALTPNTPYNGALMVLPGSHRTYVQCIGETPEDHFKASLRAQTVGVPDDASMAALAARHGIAMPTGPAGSVLFFDCNIMHGSNGNISPQARTNLFFVYNSVDNAPTGGTFGPAQPRPHFLGSRDTTPTERW